MNQYINGSSSKNFRLLLFLLLTGILNFSLMAQEVEMIQVNGSVVNEAGEPIQGAILHAGEGTVFITTDEQGSYSTEVGRLDRFLIEADGYHSQQIDAIDLQSAPTITLIGMPFQMSEQDEVHVPFGKLMKRQIPGAVSVVDPEDILSYDARQSVYSALNSRVPGLIGNLNNRGIGQSLVVVDGIPRPANTFNLAEVEQISYLKDATSRMLYGSLADNGVIMVTTKRGEAYKRKISVSAEYGLSDPISYPKFLGSYDYARLYNEASLNDGIPAFYDSTEIEGYRTGANPLLYPDQDYYTSEFLRNYRPFASVITEFSGGNQRAQYYMNLGWNTQGTLLTVGEGAKERSHLINIRGNVDFQITDFIKMNLDVVGRFEMEHSPHYTGSGNDNEDFWNYSAAYTPNRFPMLIDTNLIHLQGNEGVLNTVDGNKLLGGTSQYQTNIYGDLVRGGYENTMDRTGQLNTGLDFDLRGITMGLTAKVYLSFDIYNFFRTQQANEYAIFEASYNEADSTIGVTKIGNDDFTGSQGIGGVTFNRYTGYYGILGYNRVFRNIHRVDVTGMAYSDRKIDDNTIHHVVNLHFGLRANYMFRDKILLDFSAALPGSPKFAPGNRFKLSPSFGAGWIISEEAFLENSTVLNYMKLKASYGILNTDRSLGEYYLYDNNFVQGAFFDYGDSQARRNNLLRIDNVGNTEITYVKRKELNIGLEASLLDNSLWLEANYFNSNSDGRILRRNNAYPAYNGGFNAFENYGSISDQGVEFGIDFREEWSDFRLNLGLNFVYTVPKNLKLDEPNYEYDYLQRTGKPSDAIFGWVDQGLFADSTDIADHAIQTYGQVQPGDVKYEDLNDDGKIDDNDQKMIGNNDARMQLGINLRLRYKNLELFAQGVYQSGANEIYRSAYYWLYGNRKYSELALGRWTPETAATASYPRLSTQNNSNNFRNSTYWMYDDDYFNLRALQLTYTFPEAWMQNMPTKKIQVYLRGSNLLTISPSREQRELNIGNTPQYRSYAFGLQMTF